MFFTNKHVITALIIAPIIAILAWFAVGEIAGEKPHLAQAGKSYPLVEKSNCRYQSGRCELHNEDFKLLLELKNGSNLEIHSVAPLKGIMINVGSSETPMTPAAMTKMGSSGKNWRYGLPALPGPGERIHLVAATRHNSYFGESATTFMQPQ